MADPVNGSDKVGNQGNTKHEWHSEHTLEAAEAAPSCIIIGVSDIGADRS